MCALSVLPPWHSEGAEQHPCLKGKKMPCMGSRDAAERKAGREAKLPRSGSRAAQGFSFIQVLLFPVFLHLRGLESHFQGGGDPGELRCSVLAGQEVSCLHRDVLRK